MVMENKINTQLKTIIVLATIVLIVALAACSIKTSDRFTDLLVTKLHTEDKIQLSSIFDFSFDRAYVFSDCYLSGEGLNKRYDLGLSINEVESGVSENIQRIVFVDEFGEYVFLYECPKDKINFKSLGQVLYPETIISRNEIDISGRIVISFNSDDYYLFG